MADLDLRRAVHPATVAAGTYPGVEEDRFRLDEASISSGKQSVPFDDDANGLNREVDISPQDGVQEAVVDGSCSCSYASSPFRTAMLRIPHSMSLLDLGQPVLEDPSTYDPGVDTSKHHYIATENDTRSPLEGFLSSLSSLRRNFSKPEFRAPEFLSKLPLFRSGPGWRYAEGANSELEECSTEASTGRTIVLVEPDPPSPCEIQRQSSTPPSVPPLTFPFVYRLPNRFGTVLQQKNDGTARRARAVTQRSVILTAQDFFEFALTQFSLNNPEHLEKLTHADEDICQSVRSTSEESGDAELVNCWPGKRTSQASDARASDRRTIPSLDMTSNLPPIILIPGGGIFYFWKAGFTLYLTQHFDLSNCIFLGTSAGALAGLLACVNPDRITWASRLAIQFAMKRQVFEKAYFLAGSLHHIAREWLSKVIPDDYAFESLKWRLVVVALRVSRVRLEGFSDFVSKVDLIECLLASIHIPFYANGKPSVKARGLNYLDGSFGGDLRLYMERIPSEKIVTIKCSASDYVTPIAKRECIRKLPPTRLLGLLTEGFEYAKLLHESGGLPALAHLARCPPGSYSLDGDPHLDPDRIMDETLN